MSYCVNCGVKLKESEKVCPLCNTKVINPNNLKTEFIPAYSQNIEKTKKVNKKYLCFLITIILMGVTIITVLCNLIFTGNITWSIYVVASILFLNSKLSFVLFKNKFFPLFIDLLTTETLIYVIAYLNNGLHWFYYLVCPFIFIIWIYIILCTFVLSKKKYNLLRRFSVAFSFISVILLIIESCIDMYKYEKITINWSIYAILPIIIIGTILFLISYNRKLIEEIKQRIFI
jgi:hypothetical protein